MPAHAPPARPTAGYTVMSWHCVSVRGANGDAHAEVLGERVHRLAVRRAVRLARHCVQRAERRDSRVEVHARRIFARDRPTASTAATTAAAGVRCDAGDCGPPPRPPRPPRPVGADTKGAGQRVDRCDAARRVGRACHQRRAEAWLRAAPNSAVRRLFAVSAGDAPWPGWYGSPFARRSSDPRRSPASSRWPPARDAPAEP